MCQACDSQQMAAFSQLWILHLFAVCVEVHAAGNEHILLHLCLSWPLDELRLEARPQTQLGFWRWRGGGALFILEIWIFVFPFPRYLSHRSRQQSLKAPK